MIHLPPEKLGSFYLGAKYDVQNRSLGEETVNYDARDLTTHAVCVGMTGSGKTGLCIGLLEEAALDQVPALIIDPKGDMTNLLLQFDDLAPESFAKWINPDDAGRKGLTTEEYAAGTAKKWKEGLAQWGQGPERIRALKNSVDYTIYTPGSDSGVPVNILGSFSAPKLDFESNAEMIRERIQGTVAALLGMIESKEDPVRSREGILLATIFENYWRKGEDLDLGLLITSIQKPPFDKLGVFDVDTFFPEKDRFDMAMAFNTLMASPQFSYWLQGEPLDIDKLYFTPEGKPRHSIFYIAHLSESERMFFVTLLLNNLISWMRSQSGTTSLRSLLYFDEIFGYFPPTAQPPSKKPLLTILKQARAYGLGAVLVTQNPVDIDYKGLSNAGTWFIGKLQTERDKERVLDGLQGAIAEAGGGVKTNFSDLISGLSSRVFLLHNVHEAEPVVFNTRWAMSYLRGPMTRPQLRELMAGRKKHAPIVQEQNSQNAVESPSEMNVQAAQAPSLGAGIEQRFLAVWRSASEAKASLGSDELSGITYKPKILITGQVGFYDEKRRVDEKKKVALLANAPDEFGTVDWRSARSISNWKRQVLASADHPDNIPTSYDAIPDSMDNSKEFTAVKKDLADWLYREKKMSVLEHEDFEISQEPDESKESFRMRVQQISREDRDEALDKIRDKFDVKFKRLQEKMRKEEQDLMEAEAELKDRKTSEWIGVAETVFSVFVKRRSRSLTGATSKSRMRRKASQKVQESEEDLEALHESYEALDADLKEQLDEERVKWEESILNITTRDIKPRRTDVKVDNVMLIWEPYWTAKNGSAMSAVKVDDA